MGGVCFHYTLQPLRAEMNYYIKFVQMPFSIAVREVWELCEGRHGYCPIIQIECLSSSQASQEETENHLECFEVWRSTNESAQEAEQTAILLPLLGGGSLCTRQESCLSRNADVFEVRWNKITFVIACSSSRLRKALRANFHNMTWKPDRGVRSFILQLYTSNQIWLWDAKVVQNWPGPNVYIIYWPRGWINHSCGNRN